MQMRLGSLSQQFATPSRTTSEHRHEDFFPGEVPISSGNDGIQALKELVNSMRGQIQNQDDPIVLGEMSLRDLMIRQRD